MPQAAVPRPQMSDLWQSLPPAVSGEGRLVRAERRPPTERAIQREHSTRTGQTVRTGQVQAKLSVFNF